MRDIAGGGIYPRERPTRATLRPLGRRHLEEMGPQRNRSAKKRVRKGVEVAGMCVRVRSKRNFAQARVESDRGPLLEHTRAVAVVSLHGSASQRAGGLYRSKKQVSEETGAQRIGRAGKETGLQRNGSAKKRVHKETGPQRHGSATPTPHTPKG